ncbi:MAG: N-acetylmannosamine-6-phosphate 2-epimerase [Anaerolineae bacterium]|nr:N-acetylmannosamine-6-phosphate 2-epimerase [Anaerolineae bacterium]
MINTQAILKQLAGGLIVSVQPDAYRADLDPMNDTTVMVAMARSVLLGGAVGIRANSPAHVRAIRAVTDKPLIGLYKFDIEGFAVRITPTLALVLAMAEAGADIIALDATARPRPEGMDAGAFIQAAKAQTGCLVMADISTFEEGLAAAEAGADFIATTLSGYTEYTQGAPKPDYSLVERLAAAVAVPVVAEGRIETPAEAARMLACGAFAVTVGSAITRPRSIAERFARAMQEG